MSKFQRQYTIKVQGRSGNTYVISDPLTLVFNVNRRNLGTANVGTFMVYNLSAATRKDLEFERVIDIKAFPTTRPSFQFFAGYVSEGSQPMVFAGIVARAFSYRDGPNIITEFIVRDGGDAIMYAQVERTRNYPWDPETELRQLVALLEPYGVTLGKIGTLVRDMQSTRGITWIGSVWDILKKIAFNQGGYAFIDLNKAYILAQRDTLNMPGSIPKLDATTGLIGTPRRTDWTVDADVLFEPRINPAQSLNIEVVSSVTDKIRGKFLVQAVAHRGIISAAKDGGVMTSLSLVQLPESIVELQT